MPAPVEKSGVLTFRSGRVGHETDAPEPPVGLLLIERSGGQGGGVVAADNATEGRPPRGQTPLCCWRSAERAAAR